jgi:hypothetical protein
MDTSWLDEYGGSSADEVIALAQRQRLNIALRHGVQMNVRVPSVCAEIAVQCRFDEHVERGSIDWTVICARVE